MLPHSLPGSPYRLLLVLSLIPGEVVPSLSLTHLIHYVSSIKNIQKTIWQFFKKLNIKFPCNPTALPLDRQTFRHTMIGMHRYIDREIHRDKHIQTSQNNILFYLSGMWWALPTPVKFFLGHLLIRWLQIRWLMEYPHLLLVWYLSAHTHLPDTAEATTSCSTGSLWCQTDV